MKEYQSLAHARWDCKYHVVFIPKGRKKAIFAPGGHPKCPTDGHPNCSTLAAVI